MHPVKLLRTDEFNSAIRHAAAQAKFEAQLRRQSSIFNSAMQLQAKQSTSGLTRKIKPKSKLRAKPHTLQPKVKQPLDDLFSV